jgi:hypothetical protein
MPYLCCPSRKKVKHGPTHFGFALLSAWRGNSIPGLEGGHSHDVSVYACEYRCKSSSQIIGAKLGTCDVAKFKCFSDCRIHRPHLWTGANLLSDTDNSPLEYLDAFTFPPSNARGFQCTQRSVLQPR